MNSVRLACAFFMHLQLYPELEISLNMIKYGLYNSENFKSKATVPMLLCIFKITGAIVATVGSSYLICRAQTCSQCLIFFMGMSIVANIDNLMALTVTNMNISSEISNNPIYFNKSQRSWKGDLQELEDWKADKNMGVVDWIFGLALMIFHRTFKTFFIVAYFYFCPFLVLLLLDWLRCRNPKIIPAS